MIDRERVQMFLAQAARVLRTFFERAAKVSRAFFERAAKVLRTFFEWAGQVVLYLVQLILRVFSRLLLLLSTILPLVFLVLAFLFAFEWATDTIRNSQKLMQVVTFLTIAGLFSGVLQALARRAWTEMKAIPSAIWKALGRGWLPVWDGAKLAAPAHRAPRRRGWLPVWDGAKQGKNLAATRKNFAQIPQILISASRLTIALFVAAVLVVVAYPLLDRAMRAADQHVVVVDAGETQQEIKFYMRSDALFYIAHLEDADLEEGKGICLGQPQRAWLDEFRKAIANCLDEAKEPTEGSSKPEFKVTGYASIAPMEEDGDTKKSNELNCKVANWRAAAVGAYLANPGAEEDKRWDCDYVKENFSKGTLNENECGELYAGPEDQSNSPFRVKVHQWAKPSKMLEGKPIDDGALPDKRRYDVEILNRVVHIEVPKGFCNTQRDGKS